MFRKRPAFAPLVGGLDSLADRRQAWIDALQSQQETYDLLVESEVVAEAWWLGLVGVPDQRDQAVAEKRRIRREVDAARDLRLDGWAQQVEGEVDAGPSARHVVLEIGVEPLVARIELGGQRNEQHVGIDG